jgi:hypothetical protein
VWTKQLWLLRVDGSISASSQGLPFNNMPANDIPVATLPVEDRQRDIQD